MEPLYFVYFVVMVGGGRLGGLGGAPDGSGSEAAPGDCFHMDEYFKEVKLHRMI